MPGRDRTQNKERFASWLLRQIDSNQFKGVCWLDGTRTLFRLPWKHLNIKNKDAMDYEIFKAWAIQSGKYNARCEDPPTWKTNFRCALNGVVYRDIRIFSEIEDHSGNQHDPHKIYRFNGDHNDLRTSTAAATTVPLIAEQSLWNEYEEEEDYTLHISPDIIRSSPFVQSQDVIEELLRNILLDPSENGIQQALQFSQDDHAQVVPFVDDLFVQPISQQWSNCGQEQCVLNGHDQSVPYEAAIHIPVMHEQSSQHQGYNAYHNGCLQNVAQTCQQATALPPVGSTLPSAQDMYDAPHGCTQDASNGDHSHMYSYHTPTEECAGSAPVCNIPPVVNGQGLTSSQEAQVNLIRQQISIPPLSAWDVTIFYRGKEVLKQKVKNNFYITHDVSEAQLDPADIVRLPTTNGLVDNLQIQFTEKILKSVGGGLALSLEESKVYAKRMGNSRIYWGLSESLESRENAAQAKMLPRDVPTEIFDFKQFWEDMKDYSSGNRSSPDYTLYMSFGQILHEPVKKRLVLVKLVPEFCTFVHQAAQREGASSLHTEMVSLQISNGSSFNGSDLDGPCLMDLDFEFLSSCYLQD